MLRKAKNNELDKILQIINEGKQFLKEQGINKYEYGRESFLKACWDWTHEYSENIRNQWGKLGLSLAYS